MRTAVQLHHTLDSSKIAESGFDYCEIPVQIDGHENGLCDSKHLKVSGAVIHMKDINVEVLGTVLEKVNLCQGEYLCIETTEMDSVDELINIVKERKEEIKLRGVKILIENGFITVRERFMHGIFSDANQLCTLVQQLNSYLGSDCFGICFNVGYANLLECNIKEFVSQVMPYLYVVHVNDNDCKTNQKQMPFTFTYGRGAKITEWNTIVGRLFRADYKGWVVYDNTGTFIRTPEVLHSDMLCLMKGIVDEWSYYETFEEKINDAGKEMILFGTGKMAWNYMENWGKKYPPAFFVDNNQKNWGSAAFGYKVCSPQDILAIKPEGRNVWICNMHYREIGAQLERMGVEYQCYNDEYFM